MDDQRQGGQQGGQPVGRPPIGGYGQAQTVSNNQPAPPKGPKGSIWDVLSPKKAFWGGAIAGIALSAIVGLVITLVVTNGETDTTTAKVVDAADGADTAPVAPTPEPAAVGSMDVEEFRYVRGAEEPSLYLVEYSDFECPFCGRHHPNMLSVMEDYGDQVAWVYKHFPLSFHPEAMPSAIASECAGDQGKFWEFADAMFGDQDALSEDFYNTTAADLGLDMTAFATCLEDPEIKARVTSDQSEGTGAGVRGTPATFLVDVEGNVIQQVSGAVPLEQLQTAIDANL